MKRFGIAVGLVLLVFAVSLWAQTAAPKPDPEFKKLDVFLGKWTYEIEYKAVLWGPATKASGEQTSKRILGGFFFQNQFTEKGTTGEMQGIEIIGYDPANKNFFSNEYHSDGNMWSGAYIFNGNTLVYTGKFMIMGKPYMVKSSITPAADSMSIMEKGEISTDGKAWAPFFEAKLTKAKPAPKK
jgi:hypothetical protein